MIFSSSSGYAVLDLSLWAPNRITYVVNFFGGKFFGIPWKSKEAPQPKAATGSGEVEIKTMCGGGRCIL